MLNFLIFNTSQLFILTDLKKNQNFRLDGRAVERIGIHKKDHEATKVFFYKFIYFFNQKGTPHEYIGIAKADPFLRKSLETALEFLRPFFRKMEEIYKIFAPELYKATLEKIRKFKSRIFS